MPSTAMSFINLPAELILEIHDHLPLDALLALKLTHPRLNEIVPLDSRRWQSKPSDCSHRAICTYLAPSIPRSSHMRCVLCKATYPVSMFKSSSSPACVPTTQADEAQQMDVVELPSRVCCWHALVVGTNGSVSWTRCVCTVERSKDEESVAASATAVR
ncbi:hypothetical protein BDW02DRAFT_591120 [Decorospora gaudefroyi]|uniref:F-box domain-containing protein n=1 Tax=Decorospora gaudefroyi TaxID=184978 RepID=A0A6A5KAH6_9PLEO|nr:hypothetical protein BDW02DRAFT_591120 [Decorospora gaudefroyi]